MRALLRILEEKGHAQARDAGHALRLPAVGAARERAQLCPDAHRPNVFRRLGGASGRGAGRFGIAVGRRPDAAVGADRSGAGKKDGNGPRTRSLARRRSSSPPSLDRRAPSPRGAVDASSRLALRDRHRLARADPHRARTDHHGSNCSRGSRGSKGLVLNAVPSVPAVPTARQPWNAEPLERSGTDLGTIGTVGTVGIVGWFLFCWVLSGLSVWRGSRPAPESWINEARAIGQPHRTEDTGRGETVAEGRQVRTSRACFRRW